MSVRTMLRVVLHQSPVRMRLFWTGRYNWVVNGGGQRNPRSEVSEAQSNKTVLDLVGQKDEVRGPKDQNVTGPRLGRTISSTRLQAVHDTSI